jgi:hypothetical protein
VPTVLPKLKGWRVVIYTNDHLPPHVHVMAADVHARFELFCDLGQVRLMSNIGFEMRQIQQVEAYLLKHVAHLCSEWGKIHGDHG